MILRHPLLQCLRPLRKAIALALPALVLGAAAPAGAQVVISQIYMGGGAASSTYNADFVELHNTGTSAVSISGWSLQYQSSIGNTWSRAPLPTTGSVTIAARGFYLVRIGAAGTTGTPLPTVDANATAFNLDDRIGKLALVSNNTTLTIGCPSANTAIVVDRVGYGNASPPCSETTPANPIASSFVNSRAIGRENGLFGSCRDTNNNRDDFQQMSPFPRNTASATAQACVEKCGLGIALTTSPPLWQQLSLACVPRVPGTVDFVFGGGTTGKLDSSTYGTSWSVWRRNGTNTGNVQMALGEAITAGTGHWIRSDTAPVGGKLFIGNADADATPVATTGVTGCQSANGCYVLPVPSATPGTRMLANPLPYDIEWSKVRVRVHGSTSPITPSVAQADGILSNQIWIWNGTNYSTWNDSSSAGNLQYFKSFFVNVLATNGQTIELLVPALGSTIPSPTALPDFGLQTGADGLARTAFPDGTQNTDNRASRSAWLVDLGVHNVETGWNATAKLGQWPGAEAGRDLHDMLALAPFGQPHLTVVFPRAERRNAPVDYSADLRPDNGFASSWDFEVRAQPLNSNVVLRWNARPAVLAKSRLIDRDTGLVVYPTDPGYAYGYPMMLNSPVRRLTWEYVGN